MSLLSSVTGHLSRILLDHSEPYMLLSGGCSYLITAGPAKGGTIIVDTGHDNCVLLDVLNNRDERTLYRVYTPEEAPALVDSALRALFSPGGLPAGCSENGALRITGTAGHVSAAKDALLSTGAWALVAQGQDGLNSYAELAPADGSQAPVAAAALAGGPPNPSSGVMAL